MNSKFHVWHLQIHISQTSETLLALFSGFRWSAFTSPNLSIVRHCFIIFLILFEESKYEPGGRRSCWAVKCRRSRCPICLMKSLLSFKIYSLSLWCIAEFTLPWTWNNADWLSEMLGVEWIRSSSRAWQATYHVEPVRRARHERSRRGEIDWLVLAAIRRQNHLDHEDSRSQFYILQKNGGEVAVGRRIKIERNRKYLNSVRDRNEPS
jgi:hypothetical protein